MIAAIVSHVKVFSCFTFAFGGQVFQQYVNIIPQISGVYLDRDLKTVIAQLHSMVLKRPENGN